VEFDNNWLTNSVGSIQWYSISHGNLTYLTGDNNQYDTFKEKRMLFVDYSWLSLETTTVKQEKHTMLTSRESWNQNLYCQHLGKFLGAYFYPGEVPEEISGC